MTPLFGYAFRRHVMWMPDAPTAYRERVLQTRPGEFLDMYRYGGRCAWMNAWIHEHAHIHALKESRRTHLAFLTYVFYNI